MSVLSWLLQPLPRSIPFFGGPSLPRYILHPWSARSSPESRNFPVQRLLRNAYFVHSHDMTCHRILCFRITFSRSRPICPVLFRTFNVTRHRTVLYRTRFMASRPAIFKQPQKIVTPILLSTYMRHKI